ncbi:MAG: ornithine cyclodeaminase family protein [Acidobacteriia bacterium]|nr:ornithine cyclodeaminase family protein [Terriglobia bacterium]
MLLLREKDVLRLLSMKEAISVVREAFVGLASGAAQNHARRRLSLPSGAVLHSLAGAIGNYFGTKIYSTHPKHGAHFLVMLYDGATGRPLAIIEANHLGQIRTGAASGVATDLLAVPDADRVGVIGSGFQARTQLEAVLAVRFVQRVKVWSRDPDKRERFARQCTQDFGVQVEAASSAQQAVEDAGIVVTATFAKDPVLESAWVSSGAHINAIGSNNPQRREIPVELLERAAVVAVDSLEQARLESGDLLLAWPPETWAARNVVELQQVAARKAGRTDRGQVTVFKSNGLGVQDVAVAASVYERAIRAGAGQALALMGA